ncbi:hypothetical protein O0I10_012658 [Lichtheimia ornata]|uniref:Vacuolar ATPase assembly protein VMA22 n=1 Tax=Lichtheimia ornata TaxID=688661 RepID=A0AAD7USQ0_9FUNG|nr:uncharacterized protein O0I10_012658 [Lichtheimia ornata]KAJ8651765.1 hypothetical protein O0I10_012658 [Lichtheimia ornata]
MTESLDDDLESVCKQLDSLSLKYLEKVEEYSQRWQQNGRQFQQGFLHLAHAKYTMGPGKISQCYYDERMKATSQIRVEEDTERFTSIKVAPQQQESTSTSTKSSSKQQLPPPQQQPTDSPIRRRRREPNSNGHWVQDENKKTNEFEMQHQSKKSTIRDPLHWFGLLVSPSLRASQDHFKTVTQQLVEQANCIHDLDSLENEYRQLEKRKQKLLGLKQYND